VRKTKKNLRVTVFLAKIKIRYLINISQKWYHYANLMNIMNRMHTKINNNAPKNLPHKNLFNTNICRSAKF
jgi:hypothetical protein